MARYRIGFCSWLKAFSDALANAEDMSDKFVETARVLVDKGAITVKAHVVLALAAAAACERVLTPPVHTSYLKEAYDTEWHIENKVLVHLKRLHHWSCSS